MLSVSKAADWICYQLLIPFAPAIRVCYLSQTHPLRSCFLSQQTPDLLWLLDLTDITTSPECCPLEKSLAADLMLPLRQDLPQSNEIRCDDPRSVQRTTSRGEHQEQSVHSGSLDPVNQETIPHLQETQAPKKFKKLTKFLANLRRKNSTIAESPHKEAAQVIVGDPITGEGGATLSVPSAGHSFARSHADGQAQIQ